MEEEEEEAMDIGQPTDVRHVTHVTYDRFSGFLGLPSEFEPDVPREAPSASTSAFGVSTQSMQLSYDSRGNCVPVILLLIQSRLYAQEGLQTEGIFRITGDNSEEEYVREQLNKGVIPEGIDVHCLAGLIKAWLRELPSGILDPLPSDQVMKCETEEDFVNLVKLLPQTEASLLKWAINLMADVVQNQHLNKMNSRNVALVFAPNMSRMADPLTALMYAVQVMNLIKTLIEKALRDREAGEEEERHDMPCKWCGDDHGSDEDEDDKEMEHESGEEEKVPGEESSESVNFSKKPFIDGIRSDSTKKNVGKPSNSDSKNAVKNFDLKSGASPNSVCPESGFRDVEWE